MPQPVFRQAELPFAQLLPATSQPEGEYTVTFLSEDRLALLVGSGVCRLWVLQRVGQHLRPVAETSNCGAFPRLSAVGGQRILASFLDKAFLCSSDLRQQEVLNFGYIVPFSQPEARFIGFSQNAHWTVYRIGPPTIAVQSGPGELQSLSDEWVVFRQGSTVRTEDRQGVELGHFSVPYWSSREAEMAGPDRLLRSVGTDRILNFQGKELVGLPKAPGWGSEHSWSADHQRLLYDCYTRRVSWVGWVGEWIKAVIGAPQKPTGEIIRVVDTRTGHTCFELDSPQKLLGRAYERHAALSASGQQLALIDEEGVILLRLSDQCRA